MKVLTVFDIETRTTQFTLVISGRSGVYHVARYWNIPRRTVATGVGGTTHQWSGEVSSFSMDEVLQAAKSQIESLDGPILSMVESQFYRQAPSQCKVAGKD